MPSERVHRWTRCWTVRVNEHRMLGENAGLGAAHSPMLPGEESLRLLGHPRGR